LEISGTSVSLRQPCDNRHYSCYYSVSNVESFLPRLKHTTQALENGFGCLPESTRIDLALTLVESFRFPTKEWKRFAVTQAKAAAASLSHPYLNSRIVESQSILHRLNGDIDKAVHSVEHVTPHYTSHNLPRQVHAAAGQVAIQRSLNFIQVEKISDAQQTLENWKPIDHPSLMEQIVFVRKQLILGRSLRLQGQFDQAWANLEESLRTVRECGVHTFDEDLSDLTCESADTLRELNRLADAESLVRIEMTRREHSPCSTRGLSALQLSLAETLFAQKRFEEAFELCVIVQPRAKLLKVEKLRLHIVQAKIRHSQGNYSDAMVSWSEALKIVHRFPMTNGCTTHSILSSVYDCLYHLGHNEAMPSSLAQIQIFDSLARPDSVQHWIAGTQQWLRWLDDQHTECNRSRL
jgi:tetratricopeptide (TPR) repeat protein